MKPKYWPGVDPLFENLVSHPEDPHARLERREILQYIFEKMPQTQQKKLIGFACGKVTARQAQHAVHSARHRLRQFNRLVLRECPPTAVDIELAVYGYRPPWGTILDGIFNLEPHQVERLELSLKVGVLASGWPHQYVWLEPRTIQPQYWFDYRSEITTGLLGRVVDFEHGRCRVCIERQNAELWVRTRKLREQ